MSARQVAWRKLDTTLKVKAVTYTAIDGADAHNKAKRSALWDVSTEHTYPQVFFVTDGDIQFVGGMDKIQEVRAPCPALRGSRHGGGL